MIEIDVGEVLELFAGLNGRQQKQVYRNALRRAANILVRETRSQLKGKLGRKANSRNWWNNRTISSGIKSTADKEGKAAKVHIMGDFRLKFFEMGTDPRKTKGNNTASVRGKTPIRRQKKASNRGRIEPRNFFSTAKQNKEKEIFGTLDKLISESIQRVYNKRRK